jgi:hypothetical protein
MRYTQVFGAALAAVAGIAATFAALVAAFDNNVKNGTGIGLAIFALVLFAISNKMTEE